MTSPEGHVNDQAAPERGRGFLGRLLHRRKGLKLRAVAQSPYKAPALVFGPARFLALFLFGLGLAYVEAACVTYLWGILYWPEGFHFPLLLYTEVQQTGHEWLLAVEFGREVATIAVLAGCAIAAGRTMAQRVASFLFLFGVWDILYYFWLRVITQFTAFPAFPASFGTWDILFLIPVPWTAPVYAPMAVAATMILFSMLLVFAERRGSRIKPDLRFWIIEGLAILMIFGSFIWNCREVFAGEVPYSYPWWVLVTAEIIAVTAFGYLIRDCFFREA